MDKPQKEKKRDEITSKNTEQVNFLQSKIDNLTNQFNADVKVLQDEIDTLKLQNDALTNFKIK